MVTINQGETYDNVARVSTVSLTAVNALVLYSTLGSPLFTAAVSAIVANPFFIVPSLYINYVLYQKYYMLFYGDRVQVSAMYLKSNGKQIIVETKDGESKVINNTDIYEAKKVQNKYEDRIDFGHGANVYNYIKGNSHVFDSWVLSEVMENNFIDVKN